MVKHWGVKVVTVKVQMKKSKKVKNPCVHHQLYSTIQPEYILHIVLPVSIHFFCIINHAILRQRWSMEELRGRNFKSWHYEVW
jgi:hypothetical protein